LIRQTSALYPVANFYKFETAITKVNYYILMKSFSYMYGTKVAHTMHYEYIEWCLNNKGRRV